MSSSEWANLEFMTLQSKLTFQIFLQMQISQLLANVVLMLGQRRRRWHNIKTTLAQMARDITRISQAVI